MSAIATLSESEARTARLRDVICQCENRIGRHACDVYAEQASESIRRLKVSTFARPRLGKGWNAIVEVIAQELKS